MRQKNKTRLPVIVLHLLVSALLAGCGFSTTDELNAWLAKERKAHNAPPLPISAPHIFEPEPYLVADQTDPFSGKRFKVETGERSSTVTPAKQVSAYDQELAGERGDLEKLPLDALEFKGTMFQDGVPVALVWANRQLHQVKLGDYVGPNRGKVLQINAKEVLLRELLQDGSGQWKSASKTLALSGGTK